MIRLANVLLKRANVPKTNLKFEFRPRFTRQIVVSASFCSTGHSNNDKQFTLKKHRVNSDDDIFIAADPVSFYNKLYGDIHFVLENHQNKDDVNRLILGLINNCTNSKVDYDFSTHLRTLFNDEQINNLDVHVAMSILHQLPKLGFAIQNHKLQEANCQFLIKFVNFLVAQPPEYNIPIYEVLNAMAECHVLWYGLSDMVQRQMMNHIEFNLLKADSQYSLTVMRNLARIKFNIKDVSPEDKNRFLNTVIKKKIHFFSLNERCEAFNYLSKQSIVFSALPKGQQDDLTAIIVSALHFDEKKQNRNQQQINVENVLTAMEQLQIRYDNSGQLVSQSFDRFLTASLPFMDPSFVAEVIFRFGTHKTLARKDLTPKLQMYAIPPIVADNVKKMTATELQWCLSGLAQMGYGYLNLPGSVADELLGALAVQMENMGEREVESIINSLGIMFFPAAKMTPKFKRALILATITHKEYLESDRDMYPIEMEPGNTAKKNKKQNDLFQILFDFGRITMPYADLPFSLETIDSQFCTHLKDNKLFPLKLKMLAALGVKWNILSEALQDTVYEQILSFGWNKDASIGNAMWALSQMGVDYSQLPLKVQRKLERVMMYHMRILSARNYVEVIQGLAGVRIEFRQLPQNVQSAIDERYRVLLPKDLRPHQIGWLNEAFKQLKK